MQVFHLNTPTDIASSIAAAPSAVTIGNFDGVHLGHQQLIALLRAAAAQRNLRSCALTFEPHPREYFASKAGLDAPLRITALRGKLRALQKTQIDAIYVARFGANMAALSPQAFFNQILRQQLNARLVLVGDDFRFGAGRAGDFEWLQQAGLDHGVEVIRMDTVNSDENSTSRRYSSSSVRQALVDAQFVTVQRLLGRPYAIEGHVIHGRKLGRTLGFPTLNLSVGPHRPALQGIYVVQVHGLTTKGIPSSKPWPAVASLGTRPAVEQNGRFLLEVHLLDWQGDAYGQCLSVEFIYKLRSEAVYDSLEALTQQISLDTAAARAYFHQSILCPTN